MNSGEVSFIWQGKKKQKGLAEVHPLVLEHVEDLIPNDPQHVPKDHESTLAACGHTECLRDGILFHSHLNHRSSSPWCNWATVQFCEARESMSLMAGSEELVPPLGDFFTKCGTKCFPSKIPTFLELTDSVTNAKNSTMIFHQAQDLFDKNDCMSMTHPTETWQLSCHKPKNCRQPTGMPNEEAERPATVNVFQPKLHHTSLELIGHWLHIVEEESPIVEEAAAPRSH